MTGTDRPGTEPVLLDGSESAGEAQHLRMALSLSLITGRPFRFTHLLARGEPPGLRPQHLAKIRGAEALGGGVSDGALVGSTELSFTPGLVRPGDYVVELGPSGSAPELFLALFYPLALAGGGRLTLRGSTHLPWGASYPYLVSAWQPLAQAYGLPVQLSLKHAGFYPDGGGDFSAEVHPPQAPPLRVELPARGMLREVRVQACVGGVPFALAERQSRAAVALLRERGIHAEAENRPVPVTRSAGMAAFVLAQFEYTLAGFLALGERSRSPEDVGREAAAALADFMEAGGALDALLAQQVLLPAALLASGRLGQVTPGTTRFTVAGEREPLESQARIIERFLPVRVTAGPDGRVEVRPA
ncbi:RNA 3'-terminal phosphate cyclase [Corallococcus sp. M34]|uniref:RNA 3'-terminal phosphate cyclase n=1 Tax=Citreicoccus inhibens TaxID=2849499 RepID=UPI001C237002|nr:RNA 3'-terminal phosphate cyclase [Citreicoccus inhibens]MBU8894717.1 RNA 3'-terminal phosphate cyclase [Citreicoccus inhibens]